MVYEVKITRQGQTTIPKPLREKYAIDEGDKIIYVDLGDHIAILPVPKHPIKVLEGLKIEAKEPTYEMKREAFKTAQRLVGQLPTAEACGLVGES
jgi:AbrB family looped-hinge helix DNA binding protein